MGILDKVRNAAYEILDRKGYTSYAVALAVVRIVEATLRDENSILTVSTLLKGEYGIEDVYMGVPTVVGDTGAKRILEVNLNEEEKRNLKESSAVLKESLTEIKFQ
ncbi:L-lactate dehydrogenase P [bioreactor metagenome]|uniref:L-lactate dehydrogenase P n=1 Tax=bioreactor metagenome TaxID=1076179 RepID=A0A645FRR2_9ZZZZ